MTAAADAEFVGSIPQLYDRYLVPLIFEPYAVDLCRRVQAMKASALLEIAAGTGVVTRHLARELPGEVAITATDLNQPMLDHAASRGTARPVEWRQADAMQLPFADASFDVVVCQFGAMFFPDKGHAFAEARRVLRPGGAFLFNVWDRIEENEMIDTIMQALAALFPDDPPRFMHRGPHGYWDRSLIAQDLARGGWTDPEIQTVPQRSRAAQALDPAIGYCQGSPMRAELEAKGPSALTQATDAAAAALAQRFGAQSLDGRIQAHVVVARR
jgi:SAM-dependent methyltransferase